NNIQDTTYTISSLTGESTYYWWVRAHNNTGTGEWSEIWSFTTEDPTGIIDPEYDNSVSYQIFPNPVNDILYITGIEIFPVRIQIISDSGQVLIDKFIDEGLINVQDLVPGLYILQVEKESDGDVLTTRIVISR
ncbi:MAG: T9SS type A sorting domain-containing protein, partial [Bacteroidales bacterium]